MTTKTELPVIGCIGLGFMGRPIAQHLQKAGHQLVLYARRPEVFDGDCRDLVENGAKIAASPAEMAAETEVILLNVMAGQDVRDLVLKNPDAIMKGARPGLLIADHSTIDPQTAIDLQAQLKSSDVDFIDAPVSGGHIGAEAGTLAIMMGGNDDAVAKFMPIIAHYSKTRLHMGGAGTGQITKLCNQIAQVVTIQGIAEAMQFAKAYGADQNRVMDVMSSGFAASRMLELMGPKMIDDDFTPLMKSQLLNKDARIAQEAAQKKDLSMPALDLVAEKLTLLQDQGWQEKDVSILIKALGIKK